MKKNSKKIIGRSMILSLILTACMPQATVVRAAESQVTRIGETDRYQTAAKVATENWTSTKNVVLVCGEGYADAVSASVLAKKLDAPILLTTASSLNFVTKNALKTLDAKNVYVIGGNASVSKSVRDELKLDRYNLIELSGKDRYETNVAVANELVKLGVKPDSVMLVGGQGFSDAISVAPIAITKGQILLLGSNDPSRVTLNFINNNKAKVTVVGTNYAINDDAYKTLGAIKRVNGGANRFETNLNVLKEFSEDLNKDKFIIANASGNGYADALIASSLCGKINANLVLVDEENSKNTDSAIEYVKKNTNSSTEITVIGGKNVVSDNVVAKISGKVTEVSTPTVKSVNNIGLNQVKVVFNTKVDQDSAELVKNYEINGENLKSNPGFNASATLQEDHRTVLITFSKPFRQNENVNFKVGNAILDENLNNNISKYEKTISFLEIDSPKLESVTARGGNKLIVKFSQPIRMTKNDLSALKINRQSVENFGLNKSMTELKECSGDWASCVELYFDTPLPSGENKFTVPNGDIERKFDNAGRFPIKSTTMTFKVELPVGLPTVKNVTMDNSDTMYVTYDRAMDKQTALEDSNYKVNDKSVCVRSSEITFEDGSNDTVVKIRKVGDLFKEGDNKVIIRNDVKDTYGNSINESKFTIHRGKDSAKPEITSANIIDGKTLRIKFNKEVLNSSATNKSNYKITDSDGADITYKISKIQSLTDSDGSYRKTYDIEFDNINALKGYKYTVTVKNIEDTNSSSNVMDTWTKEIYGLDNERPAVTSIVKSANDNHEVVIFFNKAMSESTLSSYSSYFYVNGLGETKDLPSSSSIYVSPDCKSVVITFASGYSIGGGSNEKDIIKMGVVNVKDKNGDELPTMSYCDDISTNTNKGPELIDDTASLSYDGDDIIVRLSLTAPLDILNVNDFSVNGQTPDTGSIIGNDVTLIFKSGVKDNEKIKKIRDAGSSTTLSVYGGKSVDVAGRKLRSGSDLITLPPRTNMDWWKAKANDFSNGDCSVTIEFNQNIDDDIENSYDDDFIFVNETTNKTLKVLTARVDGKNVVYRFEKGSISKEDKIRVSASSQKSNINIRSIEHNNGGHEIYTPSRDEIRGITITAR